MDYGIVYKLNRFLNTTEFSFTKNSDQNHQYSLKIFKNPQKPKSSKLHQSLIISEDSSGIDLALAITSSVCAQELSKPRHSQLSKGAPPMVNRAFEQ
jgi:hypothetical protein